MYTCSFYYKNRQRLFCAASTSLQMACEMACFGVKSCTDSGIGVPSLTEMTTKNRNDHEIPKHPIGCLDLPTQLEISKRPRNTEATKAIMQEIALCIYLYAKKFSILARPFFPNIHTGAVSIDKDTYLAPAPLLRQTRAQYRRYPAYTGALKNSYPPPPRPGLLYSKNSRHSFRLLEQRHAF